MTFVYILLIAILIATLLHFVTWTRIKKFWSDEIAKLHAKQDSNHAEVKRQIAMTAKATNPEQL